MNIVTLDNALTSVGLGWRGLVSIAYQALPEGARVLQVKEKFGGLRIYTDTELIEYRDVLNKLEHISFSLCEYCGQVGHSTVLPSGWIKTVCANHYSVKVAEYEERMEKLSKLV